MSFELQDQGDGWRLRAGLLANGGESFRPDPAPRSAVDRLLAIYLHLGIRPGTIRFLALSAPAEPGRRFEPSNAARYVPAAIGGGLLVWAVEFAGSTVQAVGAVYLALAAIYLTLKSLANQKARSMLPVLLTDAHLLVLEGHGSHIGISSEIAADAITHATIDGPSGGSKPVTVTFHGPYGPVRSVRTLTMTRTMAAFALHEAKVPLAGGSDEAHPRSDHRPSGAGGPRPPEDQ